MTVEANAWLCMSSRYRAKPWLHGLSNASFSKFVEYILGDRVYNIQLPTILVVILQYVFVLSGPQGGYEADCD